MGRLLILLMSVSFALSGCGRGRASVDLWKGNRSYRSEEFDKALDRYIEAMNKRPRDPKPAFNIGDAQYKLGDFDKAKETFGALTDPRKTPPKVASGAYYNLGNAFFKKNQFKEAAEAYKRCLLIDLRDEDCRFNLVKTLERLKQPPQSRSQNKKDQQDKDEDRQGGGRQNPSKERPQSGMSQEDAQRILQAVGEKEKSATKPAQPWQKKNPQAQNPGADW